MQTVQKLAEAHWSYIQDFLLTHGESSETITKIKFHYISAFIHGYKHGIEDVENAQRDLGDNLLFGVDGPPVEQ